MDSFSHRRLRGSCGLLDSDIPPERGNPSYYGRCPDLLKLSGAKGIRTPALPAKMRPEQRFVELDVVTQRARVLGKYASVLRDVTVLRLPPRFEL
jgi:hypothetical protein